MVNPVFLAAGANLAGGIMGARGSKNAADNTAIISDYNARIDERNARALRQAAEVRTFQGDLAEVDFLEDFGDFVGAQHAYFGAAGVQQGTGTALEVALAAADEASDEITMMRYNVAVESSAIRDQAINQEMQAVVTRAEGAAKARAMRSQARSQLFKSVGSSLMMIA
jgi:hypothetical protein